MYVWLVADRRLQALLPKLIERTRAGEMSWAPLPTEGANTFVHALPEGAGSLVVRRLYSGHQLELRNANGEQLESVGEMVEAPGVATLWRLVDAHRPPPTDAYTALENDLGTKD